MGSTVFTNGVTLTDDDWFNDTNSTVYDILGDGINPATDTIEARTNLSINDLTLDSAPDPAADFIETWDTSAGLAKKVLLNRFKGTLGTYTALSGTSVDITSLPAGIRKIAISFVGMSTNGTSNILVQIGDSGGIETSGYLGCSTAAVSAAASAGTNHTTGFGILQTNAANVLHGTMTLILADTATNTWVSSHAIGFSNTAASAVGGGSKATSAVLDRIRITTVAGVDTFDAGSVNILYE